MARSDDRMEHLYRAEMQIGKALETVRYIDVGKYHFSRTH